LGNRNEASATYTIMSLRFYHERDFASALEAHTQEVEVYVKLHEDSISHPVGKYNPDWAIASMRAR
jgi:restriction endonuclease